MSITLPSLKLFDDKREQKKFETALTALKVIEAIENYYRFQDLGKVIKWADTHNGNAWTDALNRLDRALGVFIEEEQKKLDNRTVNLEREYHLFLDSILPLMTRYKEHHKPTDTRSFLNSLKVNS